MSLRIGLTTLVVGMAMVSGCSGTVAAPSSGAPASSAASTSTSASAPAGQTITSEELFATMQAGFASVKTYRTDFDSVTEVNGAKQKSTGSFVYDRTDASKVKMSGSLKGPDMTAKIIIIGEDMYLQNAQLGKRWLKQSLRNSPAGVGAQTGNPMAQAEELSKLSGTTQVIGPETVDGLATTHYRFVASGADAKTGDFWIEDATKLTRKSVWSVETGGGKGTTTITIPEVNQAVSIEAPDDSLVVQV